ncbi:hypothetical protein [Flavobacterium ovatum]|uniref:hypothetical protein n=1 Tax=Flavobacterium ovatum TaxID=1928857 RepID=UPI00345062AE
MLINENENFHVKNLGSEGVKLSVATCMVSLKVLADENLKAGGFNITVAKPWTTTNFKRNKVEKGKWIDLFQELVLPETSEKLNITVSANPKWGGTGIFYIDDLTIVKE